MKPSFTFLMDSFHCIMVRKHILMNFYKKKSNDVEQSSLVFFEYPVVDEKYAKSLNQNSNINYGKLQTHLSTHLLK